MSLNSGKSKLEQDFVKLYTKGDKLRTTREWAKEKAEAIHLYCLSGIPTVQITNFPGAVVGAMTKGPVKGTGLGGFDKPSPGMGLESAKPLLKLALIKVWSHGGKVRPYTVIAKEMALAIHSYYSQAIVQTIEKSSGPLPCPPTSGPATGPMKGIGGVLTSSQGKGFASSKSVLIQDFVQMWDRVDWNNPISISQFAEEMAEAIHKFCIQGKVNTDGIIVAPAGVSPVSGSGSYSVGTGIGKGTIT